MAKLSRIIMHWTAGAYGVIGMERERYHALVDQKGNIIEGTKKPEANQSTRDGHYTAHTRALNTGSIGLCMDCMASARERPFDPGTAPMTQVQLDAFVEMVADYADLYNIPVTRKTVLSHAEVQPTLGVRQNSKWDITWIPGMERPGDPIEVGDKIRDMITHHLANIPPPPKKPITIDWDTFNFSRWF